MRHPPTDGRSSRDNPRRVLCFPHMTTAKRAAVYLRVSTGEQHTENQEPDICRLVTARGFDLGARIVNGSENDQ
jgi:hypothetical protein